MSEPDPVRRLQELLDRLEGARKRLEETHDPERAVDILRELADLAKDLPALDDDDLRRGQASAHVRFGEGVAILAGDALLTEAFRLALAYPSPQVGRELAGATLGMIGGQYVDVTANGNLDETGLARLH